MQRWVKHFFLNPPSLKPISAMVTVLSRGKFRFFQTYCFWVQFEFMYSLNCWIRMHAKFAIPWVGKLMNVMIVGPVQYTWFSLSLCLFLTLRGFRDVSSLLFLLGLLFWSCECYAESDFSILPKFRFGCQRSLLGHRTAIEKLLSFHF